MPVGYAGWCLGRSSSRGDGALLQVHIQHPRVGSRDQRKVLFIAKIAIDNLILEENSKRIEVWGLK